MNILRLIFLAGAVQGLLTFLALFSFGKSHKRANYFLSFLVLALATNMFIDFLFHDSDPMGYLKHSHFHVLFAFTYGPLIYLYIRDFTGFALPRKHTFVLHYIPFLSAIVYMLMSTFPGFHPALNRYFFVVEFLSLLHVLLYIILAIGFLYRYERAIKNSYSNLEKLSLLWLRLIIYSMAVIILTAVLLYFWRAYFDIIWLLVAFMIYILSYFTLRKPEVLSGLIDESGSEKYKKSSLNTETLGRNKLIIETCMEKNKLYLDNEITLPMLAEKTSIPVHHLSQIINQAYGKNFYEFIGYYRIRESQEMMLSPEYNEQKIIDICYRVGFNTISAFNKSFKKITGMTPTQFRETYKKP